MVPGPYDLPPAYLQPKGGLVVHQRLLQYTANYVNACANDEYSGLSSCCGFADTLEADLHGLRILLVEAAKSMVDVRDEIRMPDV